MKWIPNRCRRRRQGLCLLASGALGEPERIELEQHLGACQECRGYYREIKALTAPLAAWEKDLSAIEATPAARARFSHALAPRSGERVRERGLSIIVYRIIWRELIWPSRFAWTGMAALWLVMLAVNGRLSDHRMIEACAHPASPQEMAQAWEEQNRVLAELTQPAFVVPAAPSAPPRPRSERARDWKMT
jgi:anti-sigma factor RsiW